MIKLKVIYMPHNNVKLISDGDSEKYVMNYIKDTVDNYKENALLTSQEMIVNWVRIAILRKLISYKDVEFLFEDKIIFPDKYGYLDWCPDGFCDYTDKFLTEMLSDMFLESKKGEL
jgi:hypothetical protein